MESVSLLTPLGYHISSCGYCKGVRQSPSYYCQGKRDVRPEHYEMLANRMWRRSGTTYYKPDSKNACCPHYTIRLDSLHFIASKNQRKVCNNFTSFILGDEYRRKAGRYFPKSKQEKKQRKGAFAVDYRVHEPEWERLPRREAGAGIEAIEPAHKLEVTLEPDTFTLEKYELFEQYQRLVHKEPPSALSQPGFKRFLCSGFRKSTYSEHGKLRPLGSFHQCYRIDGKLVAMGVLDLLPHCVSSVYFIYHFDYSNFELGKLSALREIAMAQELGYRYYYMGYYIHSCSKMRYKRSFKPTYVLDPESYQWHLFDDKILALFDSKKYVSVQKDESIEPSSKVSEVSSPPVDGASIFKCGMRGIPSATEVMNRQPLEDVPFYYGGNLVSLPGMQWKEEEIYSPHSLMGRLAEFIACVGLGNLATKSASHGGLVPAIDWLKDDEDEYSLEEED